MEHGTVCHYLDGVLWLAALYACCDCRFERWIRIVLRFDRPRGLLIPARMMTANIIQNAGPSGMAPEVRPNVIMGTIPIATGMAKTSICPVMILI